MIITRTPMRIPLGGGGSDLPDFYERNGGGFWLSGAIDKYVYVTVNPRFEEKIRVAYSKVEEADNANGIEHPIFSTVLRAMGVESHTEVTSVADLPSRSGMGSSGSFTVGLLHALSIYTRKPVENLAEAAFRVERVALGRSVGKQDQYAAMLGDVRTYRVSPSGEVSSRPVDTDGLVDCLSLFWTGVTRDAEPVLKNVAASPREVGAIKEIGEASYDAIHACDFEKYGRLLEDHWQRKRVIAGTSSPELDRIHDLGVRLGASGGKLIGAGGGGFFLFCTPTPEARRRLVGGMAARGFPHLPFKFVERGSEVLEF